MNISCDGRMFRPVHNSETGQVGDVTLFHFHQKGDLVWAEWAGDQIVFGTLIAKATSDGSLDMRYQHLNASGELMTGVCRSTPELLPDGCMRLHEKWTCLSGDLSSGESVIEEVASKTSESKKITLAKPHT